MKARWTGFPGLTGLTGTSARPVRRYGGLAAESRPGFLQAGGRTSGSPVTAIIAETGRSPEGVVAGEASRHPAREQRRVTPRHQRGRTRAVPADTVKLGIHGVRTPKTGSDGISRSLGGEHGTGARRLARG